jgi:uncharacterized protein (DUF433 family)
MIDVMDAAILAFSPDQVCRLTGLSARQLAYWDQTEFFSPAFREKTTRSPYARVYSFRDVVGLRALALMRNVHKVPLQHLRKVGAELGERLVDPWANLAFFIVGRQVAIEDEGGALVRTSGTGQRMMRLGLAEIRVDLRKAIEEMSRRDADDIGQIARRRTVADGLPVLAGTRVPTSAVWEFHVAGLSVDQILHEYPHLTRADVEAAIGFEQSHALSARHRAKNERQMKKVS